MNYGPTSFRLGVHGMLNSAEASIVERDIALAKQTRGHVHVAHLSTSEAMEAVRNAKKAKLRVTAEITPHHFTLIDENVGEFNTHYKMNPPLRSTADRDALLEGISDGTVDVIATDHAPHAFHEKQVEFERAAFGITGLETAFAPGADGSASSLQADLVAYHRADVVESREDFWPEWTRHAREGCARRRYYLRSEEEVDVRRLAIVVKVEEHTLRRLEFYRTRRRHHRRWQDDPRRMKL